jgi:DNA polymerase-3 subunit alpha
VGCLTKDIDTDFSDRDAVVRYMKDKYGENYVASVGTYGNLKIKNAIKDFSRLKGIDAGTANYITSIIKKDYEACDFTKFIELVCKERKLKDFLVKNPLVFEYFDILLHQTRTASIHACATIIVPDVDEDGNHIDIHDLMPTKIMDGQLVTEWEGAQLEKAGFLKEDILGLKQLEKFKGMIELISINRGQDINIYDIDMDQREVFDLFSEGYTEDVFQFGTDGLKGYCKYLKPDSVSELTAANALYRPGAMESDAHTDFVKIKFGQKKPDYDPFLEEVTRETYGLYIYQEQIMKAYSVITGASMEQADSFRKYITKAYKMKSKGIKDTEYEKYESDFINKYTEMGCEPKKAQQVWDKLVAFASYGFNKSHAAAYATISYISQWFKVNYPLEFWTASLNESSDDDRPGRLAEIEKSSSIKVFPVDVNESELKFKGSPRDMAIYWSLKSVKWLGEKAAELIIEERQQNGKFFSLKEFTKRLPKKAINKRAITNLILSGGFDQMYSVKAENERIHILDEFYSLIESKGIEEYSKYINDKTWWQLIQTELTGFGGISYDSIANKNGFTKFVKDLQDVNPDNYVSIGGIVTEIKVKNSEKVGKFAVLKLNCNNMENSALIWNETYESYKDELTDCENKILFLNGQVKFDKYSNQNSIQTNRNTKLLLL